MHGFALDVLGKADFRCVGFDQQGEGESRKRQMTAKAARDLGNKAGKIDQNESIGD
jgi:hypothetical protein